MRAVITVIGKDMVGILAKVSNICADSNVNIMDVTQSILQDTFCMIMMADTSQCATEFSVFADKLEITARTADLQFMLCMKIF